MTGERRHWNGGRLRQARALGHPCRRTIGTIVAATWTSLKGCGRKKAITRAQLSLMMLWMLQILRANVSQHRSRITPSLLSNAVRLQLSCLKGDTITKRAWISGLELHIRIKELCLRLWFLSTRRIALACTISLACNFMVDSSLWMLTPMTRPSSKTSQLWNKNTKPKMWLFWITRPKFWPLPLRIVPKRRTTDT